MSIAWAYRPVPRVSSISENMKSEELEDFLCA